MKAIFTTIRFNPKPCLIISAIILLTLGCTNPNPDAPSSDSVHTKGWNNPELLDSNDFHGTQANQDGYDSCKVCHGEDLTGIGEILGCFDCHFGPNGSQNPSGTGWAHGQNQHELYETHKKVCNACHDIRRTYNLDPQACHDCHGPGTNHALGQDWLDRNSPQFHGNEPTDNCSDCHDLTLTCNECHFGVSGSRAPIGSGWNHGLNNDHERYESYQSVCNRCHNLNRSYSNDPRSCHDCHDD